MTGLAAAASGVRLAGWHEALYAGDVRTPASTLELLSWIEDRPRSYEETIQAWKTTCPRLSIWDDAVTDGLVKIDRQPGQGVTVGLTTAGRTVLAHDAAGRLRSRRSAWD